MEAPAAAPALGAPERIAWTNAPRLLVAALGFAGLPRPSLWALRIWLDSWSGIGRIAVGMHRQGFDLQLTQYDERGWPAMFMGPYDRLSAPRPPTRSTSLLDESSSET
jgi:hypothetical protein